MAFTYTTIDELYQIYDGMDRMLREQKAFEAFKIGIVNINEPVEKETAKEVIMPKIEKVLFNEEKEATTVFWSDGTVTVVKCTEDDEFTEDHGVAMAIAKKFAGNGSTFRKIVRSGTYASKKKAKKDREVVDLQWDRRVPPAKVWEL